MRLIGCMIVIAIAFPARRAVAQGTAAIKGPMTLELASTVPGREVELRFTGRRGASTIVGGPMRTNGDTVFVQTPARLILNTDSTEASFVLEVAASEPWLHLSYSSANWTTDVWGQRLELRRVHGSMSLLGPFMQTHPAGQ